MIFLTNNDSNLEIATIAKKKLIAFVEQHKEDKNEKSESQKYWIDFFDCFGLNASDIGRFEYAVKDEYDSKNNTKFIDFFWEKKLLIEHKSRKKNLDKAFNQAVSYYDLLNTDLRPRYIIVSDFKRIIITDLLTAEKNQINIEELPNHVNLFRFILQESEIYNSPELDLTLDATEILTNLHNELKKEGYDEHELNVFLTRLLFCLYAEDTDIFKMNAFYTFIKQEENQERVGNRINQLFSILDKPYENRPKEMYKGINDFPYVNGALFEENLNALTFTEQLYDKLIKCCNFDWSPISPAIFGSLFQEIMDEKIRHDEGTHYTSKDNVLKVINSLFMNDLRAEFTKSKNNPKKLEILHDKISKLKFFDPSCGCGNFLVVTYEQLRLLEMDIIESLNPKGQVVFKSESRIRLSNFYGIEKQELPARICQVAMWLMEHKMDLDAENRFEIHRDNLPLKDSVNIKNTDALEIDWNEFIEPSDNVYILGNPPFISYQNQNDNQKKGLKHVFKGYKKTNQLDYVSAWFKKAAEYIQETNIQVGFISTNSICQGQQASILWKILMEDYNIHINFAHRTFVWDSEIKNKAVVYIVIIGFGFNELKKKYIYTYNHNSNIPILKSVGKINNYLYESDNIFLNVKRNKSICGAPDGFFGSMPIDHGNYLFTPDEKDTFLNEEPSAKKYMKELISAREHLHNKKKYCLWLEGINLSELKQMPLVMERVENVRSFRLASTRKETNELGKGMNAVLFGNIKLPTSDYIFVPLTTSENRDYIPFDMIKEDIVPNNTTAFIDTADLYYLGILISKMHMTWTRYVCGRLKGDYRYSLQIVYNNYPFPMKVTDSQKENIRRTTQEMLNIRNNYDESLADLYNPKYMPKELMKIHEKIDNLVDKCYSNNKFKNDDDRMKLLFKLYNEYTDNE